MKKIRPIAVWLILALLFCSCTENKTAEKPKIVATLFPQYDFCRQIAGDEFEVVLLLPPGMESHNYEPSVADIRTATEAEIFVYTGSQMEPWATSIAENTKNPVDVSQGIELDEHEHEHEHAHEHEHEHEHEELDPHIWTSPVLAEKMVDNILSGLINADGKNKEKYTRRATEYKQKLEELDKKFASVCAGHENDKIVHGGRFALSYFAKRYSLNFVCAFDSCSSSSEPSAKRVAELIETARQSNISAVFCEEMTTPRIAETIADETGKEILVLHSCHNVSKSEKASGATYLSLMENNLENLKKAFGE